MKKYILIIFLISFLFKSVIGQLSRFPYVQSVEPNSTIIAWKTPSAQLGIVNYGTSPTALSNTIIESDLTKKHAVKLTGLTANTKYYYEIYSGVTLLASEYFTTAKDSTENTFSFIHYGDCGYNNSMQNQIGDLMEADSAEFAVVCGDIDQGGVPHVSGDEGGDNYDEIFFDVYNDGVNSKMLAHECHFTAIGNHDVYHDNGATYEDEFYLPNNNPDSTERYYSFEWGNAKFIALDVITPFDPTIFPINMLPIDDRWWTDFRAGSPQYQWLEQELQCNDKEWTFVYFHEGPWTNYWGADYYIPEALGGDYYLYEGNVMVRNHLVPLFEQYNVDFVLCGHSHLYEKATKNGIMYITSGSAGDGNVSGNIQYANHPEIQLAILDNVYVKYYVTGDSISFDVINKDNNIVDSYSNTKPFTPYNVSASVTNVTCNGGNDGSVTLTVDGPRSPYSIEWFDGDTNLIRNDLMAGTHFVYVRNAYGCEKVTSVVVEEPPLLIPEIISTSGSNYLCSGETLKLTTNDTYVQAQWSTGHVGDTLEITAPGTYFVDVINGDGCDGASLDFVVEFYPTVSADFGSANSNNIYNFLASDLSATEYFWDFGDGTLDTSISELVTHTFTANGTYSVQLIASNGCNKDTSTQTVVIDNFPHTGVSDISINDLVSIFPNPASKIISFSIQNTDNEKFKLVILSSSGRRIYTKKNIRDSFFTLELDKFTSGKYFYKIEGRTSYEGSFMVVK